MLDRRTGSRDTATETRERLLDTAERLFAEEGIARTSLRAITFAAGVNVAAIHYHFGSKEALLQAVYARRLEPVNRERLARLERIEASHPGGALPLEPLIEAFLSPVIELPREGTGAALSVLFGRLLAEPEELVADLMRKQFREVADRFSAALERAVPGLPRSEVIWRLHCSIGVLGHVLASTRLREVAREFGLPDDDDHTLLRRLTTFCAAGFRAAQTKAES